MNRITFYLVIPAVVGAASIVNAIAFALSRMANAASVVALVAAAVAGVAVVLLAFSVSIRGMRRGHWARLVFALIVIVVAGFTPRFVDAYIDL